MICAKLFNASANVPRQHSAITPNNATVVRVSSNNPSSNLLHPRPLINHMSATMHSTGDSSNTNRHHYHNISTYRGSSSSSDSSNTNRHHYHNISTLSLQVIIISLQLSRSICLAFLKGHIAQMCPTDIIHVTKRTRLFPI
jgi:hypothetical protein